MFSFIPKIFGLSGSKTETKVEYFYALSQTMEIKSNEGRLNEFDCELKLQKFKKVQQYSSEDKTDCIITPMLSTLKKLNGVGMSVSSVFEFTEIYIIPTCNTYKITEFDFKMSIDGQVITDEKKALVYNTNLFFKEQNDKCLEFEKKLAGLALSSLCTV